MIDRYATLFVRVSIGAVVCIHIWLSVTQRDNGLSILSGFVVEGADALQLGIAFSDPRQMVRSIQEGVRGAIGWGMTPNAPWT